MRFAKKIQNILNELKQVKNKQKIVQKYAFFL